MKRRSLKQWLAFVSVVVVLLGFTVGGMWASVDNQRLTRLADFYAPWLGPMKVLDAWHDDKFSIEGDYFLVESDDATMQDLISRLHLEGSWLGGDLAETSQGHALAYHGHCCACLRLLKPGEVAPPDETRLPFRDVDLLVYDTLGDNQWIIRVKEPFPTMKVKQEVLPTHPELLLSGEEEMEVVSWETLHPGRNVLGQICVVLFVFFVPVVVVDGLLFMLFGRPRGCVMYIPWFLLPTASFCGFNAFMDGEPFMAIVATFFNIPSFILSALALVALRLLRTIIEISPVAIHGPDSNRQTGV